jgi:CrcB protein
MAVILYIAAFGALGCVARFYLSGWVHGLAGRGMPYGTFAVNVVGAYLVGLVMELGLRSSLISPELRTGLTIGFLGGLTTFSTFSYETSRMIESGQLLPAFVNVVSSSAACIAFTFAGFYTARHL